MVADCPAGLCVAWDERAAPGRARYGTRVRDTGTVAQTAPSARPPAGAPAWQLTLGGTEPPRLGSTHWRRLRLDPAGVAWVEVACGFLLGADTLLAELMASVPWRQGRRRMWDRMVDDPRLSRWYRRGEVPPHPVCDEVRRALEDRYGVPLAGPGCNLYRDGRDSVAPHRDRELVALDDTIVAVLTLGTRRPFLLRPVGGGRSIDLAPGSGDLLVMGGATQRDWEHAVPKVARAGPRASLSWRWSAQAGHPGRRVTRAGGPGPGRRPAPPPPAPGSGGNR